MDDVDLTARIVELEELILQLDSPFADLDAARRKGYLRRDMPRLRAEADRIRQTRQEQ
ncbi:hypothetical protein GN330_00065 [Nitratireductor sp. CAU 1489]|uniref:Uncharacterized protein n=1 Tax=Nitratireductor arenosus TaxID=2682096 RepID=A0A844QBZ3_9HYPH|nr:hypothetical protein [Nitratireductor arenosus]MVA95648.1 hypothetical protein [Nitratireductor arenosus]